MNIQQVPGLSSSALAQIVHWGPLMRRSRLREFFGSYKHAIPDATFQEFASKTIEGQIMNYEVVGPRGALARYGLEIAVDRAGPHVRVLYVDGYWLDEYVRQMAWAILRVAAALVDGTGQAPRARIEARQAGVQRFLRRHGIKMKGGAISGWQEYFELPTLWRN